MVKILLIIFVTVVIFSSALYLGFFSMLGDYISIANNDFLPYIPLEIRFWFFAIIIALLIALARSFTK